MKQDKPMRFSEGAPADGGGGHQRFSVASGTHRYIKGTAIEKPAHNEEGLVSILMHPMNILLVFLPLGVVSYYRDWGAAYVFWFNFLCMIPLAKILGDATEELAASLKNDMVAGLLNATFGNAVEMVITVQTLRAGLFSVVKTTLLGSVLSNTLLVLGMSFLCGGLYSLKPAARQGLSKEDAVSYSRARSIIDQQTGEDAGEGPLTHEPSFMDSYAGEKIQTFSVLGALVNTSMLLISCTSFSLITVFRSVSSADPDAGEEALEDPDYIEEILLPVSRISSIIIMMAYIAYILFQLVTHKEAMAEEEGEDEEDDGSHISAKKATALLFGTTIVVAFSSDLLVNKIEAVTEAAHLSESFIGIILLPIVGNACEHAAAVRFAMQDKLGLSVSIAVGSSTQIALFVVPFSVLVGWAIERPMDLDFGILNTCIITLSVVVVLSMVVDGQSNWLQGYLLCSVYGIIAVMYWFMPNDCDQSVHLQS